METTSSVWLCVRVCVCALFTARMSCVCGSECHVMLSNKLIKLTIALKANVKLCISSLLFILCCVVALSRQKENERVGEWESGREFLLLSLDFKANTPRRHSACFALSFMLHLSSPSDPFAPHPCRTVWGTLNMPRDWLLGLLLRLYSHFFASLSDVIYYSMRRTICIDMPESSSLGEWVEW